MDSAIYLASVRQQFLYYKSLAEKAMLQLEPKQLFVEPGNESNSIAIIVQHMAGNMLSRWTDFLTSDGEKEWRNRDEEFVPVLREKNELFAKWDAGWQCLFKTLDHLEEAQLASTIRIRNEQHTVVEAINRQLAHYPYHIGQIVFLAKQIKGDKFASLSIPKNKSQEFNKKLFSRNKHED